MGVLCISPSPLLLCCCQHFMSWGGMQFTFHPKPGLPPAPIRSRCFIIGNSRFIQRVLHRRLFTRRDTNKIEDFNHGLLRHLLTIEPPCTSARRRYVPRPPFCLLAEPVLWVFSQFSIAFIMTWRAQVEGSRWLPSAAFTSRWRSSGENLICRNSVFAIGSGRLTMYCGRLPILALVVCLTL